MTRTEITEGRAAALDDLSLWRRTGTGFNKQELARLAGVLKPLETSRMPLAEPPLRENRFRSPLELSHVDWVARGGRGGDVPDVDRDRPSAGGLIPGAAGG